jgi:cytochrome c biogenesis protein CcdA
MVLFGVAYAIASLGCTVGPFLGVVFLAADTVTDRLRLFLGYAVGMGLVVGIVAVAVALAKVSLVRRIRRWAAAVNRAGGVLLIMAGAYVAWYGWYEIRIFSAATSPTRSSTRPPRYRPASPTGSTGSG